MKTFYEFLRPKARKFVGLFFTPESQNELRDWAVENGFDLTKSYSGLDQSVDDFDFHTTIFFTTSEHDTPTGILEIEPFELKFNKFELLGKDRNIPVLKIDTDNVPLMRLRKRFEELGYKDEWPEYKPHISLSYNYNGTPNLSRLELPNMRVIANSIRISDQDG